MSIPQLVELLLCFVSPDNALRGQAEQMYAALKAANPREILVGLVTLLSDPAYYLHLLPANVLGREGLCALVAVLLRGIALREENLWSAMGAADMEECRRLLLLTLQNEPSRHIRRKISDAVAALSKLSPWPQLLTVVQQLGTATDSRDQQLSMYLLDKLAEHIGESLLGDGSREAVWALISPIINNDGVLAGDRDSLVSAGAAAEALCSLLSATAELPAPEVVWVSGLVSAAGAARALANNEDTNEEACASTGALQRLAESHPTHFQHCLQEVLSHALAIINCSDHPAGVGSSTGSGDTSDGNHAVRAQALQISVELLTHPSSGAGATAEVRAAFLQAAMNCTMLIDASDEGTADFFGANEDGENDLSGLGDMAGGDSDDGHLAATACTALEAFSMHFDPAEIVRVCVEAAWGLISQPDWRARRAALVVTGVVCEGTRDHLYPLLPQLVPTILTLAKDSHPRVRYVALHCLTQLITEYRGGDAEDDDEDKEDWDDDEDGDEDGDDEDSPTHTQSGKGSSMLGSGSGTTAKQESFQQLFALTVPPVLYSCATSENEDTHRVSYRALLALRMFYTPEICNEKHCDASLLTAVMQHCAQLLQTQMQAQAQAGHAVPIDPPWYLLQEAASLAGNAGLLLPENVLLKVFPPLMALLSAGVGDLSASASVLHGRGQSGGAEKAFTQFRCRSLEAIALLGKAAGREAFRGQAHDLLARLMAVMSAGLDFSDPFSSYICQTCARLSGVLQEEFAPYVPTVLPVLLTHIAQPLHIDVCAADEHGAGGAGGDDAASGEHTFEVYKRGQGLLRVTCSTYALQEKVLAARMLYQYCLDVPQFVAPYAEAAAGALCELTGTVAFDEECAMVVGAAFVELLRLYCYYPPNHTSGSGGDFSADVVSGASRLVLKAAEGLLGALEHTHAILQAQAGAGAGVRVHEERANQLMDAIRELLQLLYSLRCVHSRRWPSALSLPPAVYIRAITLCRDELMLWLDRYGVRSATGAMLREDQLALRDGRRDGALDTLGWLLKLAAADGSLEVHQAYSGAVLPFLSSVLSSGLDPKTSSPVLMAPILGLLDAILYVPECRATACELLFPSLLQMWAAGDGMLSVSCVYGLGVCMQYGSPTVEFVGATAQLLVSVLGLDPGSPPPELRLEDEDQEGQLRDNAVATLLRLSVCQAAMLGPEMAPQMLLVGLGALPLQNDKMEGQELHAWLLRLLEAQDVRVLGNQWEALPDLFRAIAAIQSYVGPTYKKLWGKQIKDKKSGTTDASTFEGKALVAQDEYWVEQIITKDTFDKGCVAVKTIAAGAGLPANIKSEVDLYLASSFNMKQQKSLLSKGY